MCECKKDVTPLLTHRSYVVLSLTHRYIHLGLVFTVWHQAADENTFEGSIHVPTANRSLLRFSGWSCTRSCWVEVIILMDVWIAQARRSVPVTENRGHRYQQVDKQLNMSVCVNLYLNLEHWAAEYFLSILKKHIWMWFRWNGVWPEHYTYTFKGTCRKTTTVPFVWKGVF